MRQEADCLQKTLKSAEVRDVGYPGIQQNWTPVFVLDSAE